MPYKDRAKRLANARRWRERNLEYSRAVAREAQAKRRIERKTQGHRNADKVAAFKTHAGCLFCRERVADSLQFHHVDPAEKEGDIGTMRTKVPWSKLLSEFQKCVVLCANCHAKLEMLLRLERVNEYP